MGDNSIRNSISTITYGSHPRQRIRLYSGHNEDPSRSLPLVVFIHGGAWRDPNNTCSDADELMGHLSASKSLFGGGASIDYRLSPEVASPTHRQDVIQALEYLFTQPSYKAIKGWTLVGHSAGAFLALETLYDKHNFPAPSKLVLVDGIYDLGSLVTEYPTYRSFVAEAFGERDSEWDEVSPASGKYFITRRDQLDSADLPTWKGVSAQSCLFQGKVQFVHSDEDELLSWKQTHRALNELILRSPAAPVVQVVHVHGKHEEVYRGIELANAIRS